MAIDNVYDIYNATLAADKPTVDTIVSTIKVVLEAKIADNISSFDFDLAPYCGEMTGIQSNRIVDRVIFQLRSVGIRCYIKIVPLNNANPDTPDINPYFTPWFNGLVDGQTAILTVTWYTRNNQEYMKTYC